MSGSHRFESTFSADYGTARQRLLAAARRSGCETQAHVIAERGPNGEQLALDVVAVEGARSDRTLVISSGLHGVEGLFGSAVQLACLEEWLDGYGSRPPVRCLLLHALNPFGVAWRRRVNEANVDLNRNLLFDGESFSGSPGGYAALDRSIPGAVLPLGNRRGSG